MIPNAAYYEPTEDRLAVLRDRVDAAIEAQLAAQRDRLPLYRQRIEVADRSEQIEAAHYACSVALRIGWTVKEAGRLGGPLFVTARGHNDARCMDLAIECAE